MNRLASYTLFLVLVALTSASSQQSGTLAVASDGAPVTGVDIFVFVNQGKQPVGTTDSQGSLPFDPALLAGKIKGDAVARTCSARTEIILVAEGERYRCEDRDENGEPCDCEPAGAWLMSNGHITIELPQAAATPLARNPLFLGAVGAGALTVIVASGGDDDSGTTTPSPLSTPTSTSGDPSTSGGPSTTPSATSFNGSYPGNFVRQRDECNFFVPNFNGTVVIEATSSGFLTAKVVEQITRVYMGTLNVTSDGNASGTATGTGSIGNNPITCEAKITFIDGRLTIEETIRLPENNNCAVTFRAEGLARQTP